MLKLAFHSLRIHYKGTYWNESGQYYRGILTLAIRNPIQKNARDALSLSVPRCHFTSCQRRIFPSTTLFRPGTCRERGSRIPPRTRDTATSESSRIPVNKMQRMSVRN